MMGRTKLVVALLSEHGALPGLTRGEIRTKLGWPEDIEVTARVREAENNPSYGALDVRCMQITRSEWRYWLPARERKRAAALVEKWIAEEHARARRMAA